MTKFGICTNGARVNLDHVTSVGKVRQNDSRLENERGWIIPLTLFTGAHAFLGPFFMEESAHQFVEQNFPLPVGPE